MVGGGGGGGVLNKFFYREALPRGSNPYPLIYTIFHEKGTPFVYFLLTNGTLSDTLFKTLHPF